MMSRRLVDLPALLRYVGISRLRSRHRIVVCLLTLDNGVFLQSLTALNDLIANRFCLAEHRRGFFGNQSPRLNALSRSAQKRNAGAY